MYKCVYIYIYIQIASFAPMFSFARSKEPADFQRNILKYTHCLSFQNKLKSNKRLFLAEKLHIAAFILGHKFRRNSKAIQGKCPSFPSPES